MRLRWLALALIIPTLTLSALACSEAENLRFDITHTEAGLHGVLISFASSEPVTLVELFDSSGRLLLRMPVPLLTAGEMLLPVSPDSGELSLVAHAVSGAGARVPLTLRKRSESAVTIRSPFSGGPGSTLLLAEGTVAPLLVTISGQPGKPLRYRVTLHSGGPLLLSAGENGREGEKTLVLEGGVNFFVRPITTQVRVVAPKKGAAGRFALTAEALLDYGGERVELKLRQVVRCMPAELIAEKIQISEVRMPTAPDGSSMGGMRPDSLVLRGWSGHSQLEDGLKEPSMMAAIPIAFQSIAIKNNLDIDVPVVVSSLVVDEKGRAVPPFSRPPNRPGRKSLAAALLPAGGGTTVTLPIFADPGRAEAGSYRRRIDLRLAGADLLLQREFEPFTVERPADLAMAVTAAAVLATIVLFASLLLRGNAFLKRFTTRQIVLVALASAVSVVLVNLPVFFLANITFTLLGPLGFLVDALLTEFLYGALLVALVAIVPRQGVCTMVAGVRFLLGGLLLGMLTPVGAVHTAVSALALEAAVWLSGTPRRGTAGGPPLRLLLFFALANALISWVGFQLSIVLFRLYYATWYIALSVFVGGFLYSLIGAAAGRRIGRRLAHISA